jgi:hypothetical protein
VNGAIQVVAELHRQEGRAATSHTPRFHRNHVAVPPGAMSRTSFLMAFRCFEFQHGDLGPVWQGYRPNDGMMGWVLRKEAFLTRYSA